MILIFYTYKEKTYPYVDYLFIDLATNFKQIRFGRVKVLVTGGAGYIGSACVELLIDHDFEVVVFDSLVEGHRNAVHSEAAFFHGDLENTTNINHCLEKHRPEAVIHFAAFALVGESMQNPGKYFKNNVANAHNLLQCATHSGIKKFVFSSTCATYGVPESMPMHEAISQNPINPYGESKLMFEKILFWYQKTHNIEPVIFRYFNAAGATKNFGEHHRIESHLIPNVLKVALGQSEGCKIFGTDYPTPDGTCVRDYIHILDLADAHIRALKPGISGAFNLGNGDGYSVKQVIDMCRKVTGKDIPAESLGPRPGDPPILVADAAKARNVLGWNPQFGDLEAIIQSAWDWHSRNPNGYSA